VRKCIIYSQLRDLTIFFVQDQNFQKLMKPKKKFFWPKQKKYFSYDVERETKWATFKNFDVKRSGNDSHVFFLIFFI
jgi:hypothetical protein